MNGSGAPAAQLFAAERWCVKGQGGGSTNRQRGQAASEASDRAGTGAGHHVWKLENQISWAHIKPPVWLKFLHLFGTPLADQGVGRALGLILVYVVHILWIFCRETLDSLGSPGQINVGSQPLGLWLTEACTANTTKWQTRWLESGSDRPLEVWSLWITCGGVFVIIWTDTWKLQTARSAMFKHLSWPCPAMRIATPIWRACCRAMHPACPRWRKAIKSWRPLGERLAFGNDGQITEAEVTFQSRYIESFLQWLWQFQNFDIHWTIKEEIREQICRNIDVCIDYRLV